MVSGTKSISLCRRVMKCIHKGNSCCSKTYCWRHSITVDECVGLFGVVFWAIVEDDILDRGMLDRCYTHETRECVRVHSQRTCGFIANPVYETSGTVLFGLLVENNKEVRVERV